MARRRIVEPADGRQSAPKIYPTAYQPTDDAVRRSLAVTENGASGRVANPKLPPEP